MVRSKQKRKRTTPGDVATWKAEHAEGRSLREIAERHRVDESLIRYWLRKSASAAPEQKRAKVSAPRHSSPSSRALEVPADGAMSPEEFTGWLATQLRHMQATANAARDAEDHVGAQRAMRIATQIATLLQKQQARTEADADTVRVKVEDMAAAAERAMQGLHQLADAVTRERASWPACALCGAAMGDFKDGDKSPLRLLFERVARPQGGRT